MNRNILGLAVAAAALFAAGAARADDWVATKLRGVVLTLVDDEWVPLKRGDVVPDARGVRTLASGRVTFERGAESIELGGDTQIRIIDRSGQQYTTVQEYFGSVAIEAEVQNVEHFAVQTPHLAAVVKGTRFTVVSGETGAEVRVERGRVAVEDSDTHQSTTVTAGQSASTSGDGPLEVRGKGDLPEVVDETGASVPESKSKKASPSESGNSGNGNAGNGNSGNGNGNSGNGNSGNGNSGNGNGNGKKDKD